jgi:hypothetical protein
MNLKKLALSSLLALATAILPASAQSQFIDRSRPSHVVEIGLHVGEGISTILQNYSKNVPGLTDYNLTPGNMNSFGASVELPFRNFIALGTGLEATINNNHWSMTLLDATAGTQNTLYTRNHFYAVEVPIYLQTRFNVSGSVRWVNELGMYLSYGIGNGSSKTHAYASSTNSLGQSQVTEMIYNRKYFKDDEPIINGVTTTDYGLHLATGLRFFDHVSLKAVFHVGFRNLAINYGVLDITNRNINLAFKVGYIF